MMGIIWSDPQTILRLTRMSEKTGKGAEKPEVPDPKDDDAAGDFATGSVFDPKSEVITSGQIPVQRIVRGRDCQLRSYGIFDDSKVIDAYVSTNGQRLDIVSNGSPEVPRISVGDAMEDWQFSLDSVQTSHLGVGEGYLWFSYLNGRDAVSSSVPIRVVESEGS